MLKRAALITTFAGTLLLAGTGCWTCSEKPSPLPTVEPTALALVPVPKNNAAWWVKRHASCKELAEKGGLDVIFIGDSITQGWESSGKEIWAKEITPLKAGNFGFSADQTQHVLWRLDNGELPAALQPKVAVIMIGTNNASHSEKLQESIAAGIGAIVDRLHQHNPKTKILLLAIFPRSEKAGDAKRKDNAAVNALIARLDGYKRVRYLDIGPKFLTPDGTLTKEIMPDRLHPKQKGYQIWADNVVPVIKEMLK